MTRKDGCRRPAAHASAMWRPKICRRPKPVATTLQATTTAATTSQSSRRRRTSGSETASSAYSENFAAVTRCVSDCERTATHTTRPVAAIQSGSAGRRGAKPVRRPSHNAKAATTTMATSDISTPRCVDARGTRTPGWYLMCRKRNGTASESAATPGLTPERMKARVLSASVSATATAECRQNAPLQWSS